MLSKTYIFLLITLLAGTRPANAQMQRMLNDTTTLELIKEGLDKSYNFEFDQADSIFKEVFKRYPRHPAYPQLMVMRQIVRLGLETSDKAIKENWEKQHKYLQVAEKYAEQLIEEDKDDLEGIFFMLNTHSFLALYYSENGQKIKAVGQAQKAYKYFKLAMKYKEEYKEFYFASGIYNYYVVQYPETHPIIKPFMVFFQGGDKELGLEELEIAARESIFSKSEARAYLIHIYGKYENNPAAAHQFSQQLVEEYPNNLNYIVKHTEQLIALEKYDEALPFIEKLEATGDSTFFRLSACVFRGTIAEKQAGDYAAAKQLYEQAVVLSESLDAEELDYPFFAYAGLARVAIYEGDDDTARSFYKQAGKSEYPSLQEEARLYLKGK